MIQQGALAPEIQFLQKPFTPRTLASKIREALDPDRGAVDSQDNVRQGRTTGVCGPASRGCAGLLEGLCERGDESVQTAAPRPSDSGCGSECPDLLGGG